ncbi:hypothetical protein R6U77_15310 [Lysinibacillus louembei]|uniref:Uncharacterized protein n=1 Tax=Lysinibacillus louembei TaxID=1470088 RepID=A0ABZ0RVE5_9BACI|nr:hypothetical protein [Lysinibacillus louembei]WPK11242.1 hypothetical protein R6U77_15310 [Lysinibacillus louembei]
MRIYTNLFDSLPIVYNQLNVISFQRDAHQLLFRKQLKEWSSKKEVEEGFCILSIIECDVTNKEVDFLEIFGGCLDLLDTKSLHQWIRYMFENNEELVELYRNLKTTIDNTFHGTVLSIDDIKIEFDVYDQIFDSLLKNMDITIMNDANFLTVLDYRKLLIKIWLQLKNNGKHKILVYHYPESDFSKVEWKKWLEFTNDLPITIICFTSSEVLIKELSLNQIHLIQENRARYELEDLQRELLHFNLQQEDLSIEQLTALIAYRDFRNELCLMDDRWVQFIKSQKY